MDLKKRWHRLKIFEVRTLEWIPKFVIACCVLHNICIMQNDLMELEQWGLENVPNEDNEADIVERELLRLGNEKRNVNIM